jgi:hypothetical protein
MCDICQKKAMFRKNSKSRHGRCDICKKPKAFLRVNGKFRHGRCWQAYLEAEEYFLFENNDIEGLQAYVQKLKVYEEDMRAVQCCSKSVYEALKLTKNRGLALATSI